MVSIPLEGSGHKPEGDLSEKDFQWTSILERVRSGGASSLAIGGVNLLVGDDGRRRHSKSWRLLARF